MIFWCILGAAFGCLRSMIPGDIEYIIGYTVPIFKTVPGLG